MTHPFAPLALPRIVRVERGRVLGGVAAGIGRSLDVDPTLVRLVFAVLALASGAGLAAYVGAWWFLPMEGGTVPRGRRLRGLVLLLLSGFLLLRGVGLSDSVVWPVALAAAGVMLLRWRRVGILPVVAGGALCLAAVATFVRQNSGGGGQPLVASGAVTIALVAIVGPWLWRLARERDAERAERIRSEERAEMASRVHDSVLQTLALIQKEDDPKRVAALARRQERELRGWLYPDAGRVTGEESLSSALEAAASEIEELHGVRVELVRTGDRPLDDRLRALVLAAREAMANAARHSGVDEVAVFVDASDGGVAVFVRDRGAGFDPAEIEADRQGIAESIRGRMERVGGEATVTAAPGEGVEVELRVP